MFSNKVVFLGSGFKLFSILTSALQMNYFQSRISREWSQNSNYEKPYVRFNKRTGVFYRATKKPRSEAVWLYHPVKRATHWTASKTFRRKGVSWESEQLRLKLWGKILAYKKNNPCLIFILYKKNINEGCFLRIWSSHTERLIGRCFDKLFGSRIVDKFLKIWLTTVKAIPIWDPPESQFFHMKRFRSFPSSWKLNKLLKITGEFKNDKTPLAPDFILKKVLFSVNEINYQFSFFQFAFHMFCWLNAKLSKHSLRIIYCELKCNCE